MGSDRLPGPQPTFLFGADRHLRMELAIAQIPEGVRFAAAILKGVRASLLPPIRFAVYVSEITSR